MTIWDKKTAQALDALADGEMRETVLRSCRHCGMTNLELAQVECGETDKERLLRSTLEWMCKPKDDVPALLKAVPAKLAGRVGKPPLAYLLTEFGGRVLRALDSELKPRVNHPRDSKDLAHRVAIFELFVRARKIGWRAEIEKVIRFDGGETRCDLYLVQPNGEALYVEVEQALVSKTERRAAEKFLRWQAYGAAARAEVNLLLVFNVAERQFEKTRAVWWQACGSASAFALEPRYALLVDLLDEQPLDLLIEQYAGYFLAGEDLAPETETQPSAPRCRTMIERWLDEYEAEAAQLQMLEDLAQAQETLDSQSERVRVFFEIATLIYEATYNPRDADELLRCNAPPIEALTLLKHYLLLPRHAALYAELREAFTWLNRQSGSGLILLRNRVSDILWTVFFAEFGIDRSGDLKIGLRAPDYVNYAGDFAIVASYLDTDNTAESRTGSASVDKMGVFTDKDERDRAAKALSWVLSALLWYPQFLGLRDKPWSKKNKKSG